MNKKLIRLTEEDLHKIVKESVNRILNEIDGLSYRQIKNVTGIKDNDEFNAAEKCERDEELESEIWRELTKMAHGTNPRKYSFRFQDICRMLESVFNIKYIGPDEGNESHDFENDEFRLSICPNIFYTRQGTLSIANIIVS